MATILMDFLQNDLFRSVGAAVVIAYPNIAQWYLPVVYPELPLEHLQRPEKDSGNSSGTSITIATFTRTAMVLSSRLWPATTTLTTQTDICPTADPVTITSFIVNPVTVTAFNTIYETLTDTITTTTTSDAVTSYFTELSGISYVAAPPRSTDSHVWCDETNERDEQGPCALRPTPTPASDSNVSESDLDIQYGMDLKEQMIFACLVIIGMLWYTIRYRTSPSRMTEKCQEIEDLKQRLAATTEDLEGETKKNQSLEYKLIIESAKLRKLSESRQQVLERGDRICESLTTIRAGIFNGPDAVFMKVYGEAKMAKTQQTKMIRDDKHQIAQCRTEIERLELAVTRKDMEIRILKAHNTLGITKDFQLSIDVKDRAFRRAEETHQQDIGILMADFERLQRQRDNEKAASDEDQARRTGEFEKLRDEHGRNQEALAILRSQYKAAVQVATQNAQALQAELERMRVGKASSDVETRELRAKVYALEADLASAQEDLKKVKEAADATTWLFDPKNYKPAPSEDAL